MASYHVGFIRNGKFVLVPISSVMQLRPDFSYVDSNQFATTIVKESLED